MFTRQELIALRKRAVAGAQIEGLNEGWARAYLRLADAADHLDAKLARCENGPVADEGTEDVQDGSVCPIAAKSEQKGEWIIHNDQET